MKLNHLRSDTTSQTPFIIEHARYDSNGLLDLRGLRGSEPAASDASEVDVSVSSDGVAFLYHHYKLPNSEWVHATRWRAIERALLPARPVQLQEVLAIASEQRILLDLDLKTAFHAPGFAEKVTVELVSNVVHQRGIIISGWDFAALQFCKRLNQELTTRAALRGRLSDWKSVADARGIDMITLDWETVRAQDALVLQEAGKAVGFMSAWDDQFFMAADDAKVDFVLVSEASQARVRLRDAVDGH